MTRLGVIADTHGLMRPEALRALAGVDAIVHAGDVGRMEVLDALAAIAPVTAVRGNVDRSGGVGALPRDAVLEIAGRTVYTIHIREEVKLDPSAPGVDLVVTGHSHVPKIDEIAGVPHLNPGSAGPRRFKLPVTLAIVGIDEDGIRPRIVPLL